MLNAGVFSTNQQEMIADIREVNPSVESKRWQENKRQVRGLVFPSLKDARKEFDESIGYESEWENTECNDIDWGD